MPRVAALIPHFSRVPELREELLAVYPDTDFNDTLEVLQGDDLINFLRGHDYAISAAEVIDDAVMEAVPELKVISKLGVGLDAVDLDAMKRRGILLGWTPGVNKRCVSELALSYIICALHKVITVNSEVREGVWRRQVGQTLTKKTVGIVGCGNIGKDLVKLLKPFNCRILVNDIKEYPDFYAEHGLIAVDLKTLLKQSDVVSLHLPLTDKSRNMISTREFGWMKPSAVLVNTARGGIVDEAALKEALQTGGISDAAFDVFKQEPNPDRELLNLPNLLATTHIGASARDTVVHMIRTTINNLAKGRLPDPSWIPNWEPKAAD